MPIGYVNTDYILFLIKDDPESIKDKVEELAFAIRMEAKMIKDLEEDMWDF